jgi:anti-anti-sigma factor
VGTGRRSLAGLSRTPWSTATIDLWHPTGTDVVVDLSALRFIDSSGLTVLVRAREAEQRGHSITLRRPAAIVAKVLAITGMDRVFTIET